MNGTELQPQHENKAIVQADFYSQWNFWKGVATEIFKSGTFPQFSSPSQIMVVMLKGREMGIPTIESLTNLYVVKGRVAMMGGLQLALVRRSGELESIKLERRETSVVCKIKRKGQEEYTTEFGQTDAARAGLLNGDNYKKYPFNMYQWRAIVNNLRVTFGDITAGLYLPEELSIVTKTDEAEEIVFADDSAVLDVDEYTRLNDTLMKTIKEPTVQNLETWKEVNQKEIEALPEVKRNILLRIYNQTIDNLKRKELKDGKPVGVSVGSEGKDVSENVS